MKQLLLLLLCTSAIVAADRAKQINRHVPISAGQKVELRGFKATDIEFKSWSQPEAYVNITITHSSSDEDAEKEYLDAVDLTESLSGDGIVMVLVQPKQRRSSWWKNILRLQFASYNISSITGEIWLPESNPLFLEIPYATAVIEKRSGPLSIDGKSSSITIRECTAVQSVDNDYGKTVIEHSGGSLNLEGKSSTVTIASFAGSVDIDADYSTISLRDIGKGAVIKSKSSTVTVERIVGDLRVDADYTTLRVTDIKGHAEIRDQSGNIKVRNTEGLSVDAPYSSVEARMIADRKGRSVRIKGQSGRLDLEDITGNVIIDNPYSRMDLNGIHGSVELRTQSGQVTAGDIGGHFTAVATYTSFHLADLRSDTINITNKSEIIELNMKKLPAVMRVRNEYGSIHITMPREFSGDVRMKVAYGSIDTNLPVTVEEMSHGGGAYVSDRIGNGKGSINLETSSGNIRVKVR